MRATARYRLAAAILIAAVAGILILIATRGHEDARADTIVAWVDGEPITSDLFERFYLDFLVRSGLQDDYRQREVFLQNMIASKLFARSLRDQGAEHEQAYIDRRDAVSRKLLLDAYADRQVFADLDVSEAELREVFARMNTSLKARHLAARTAEEANRLYDRVMAGESFEDLAREVFRDTSLANNGGSLGYFAYEEMDPAFEDAAYRLEPGEISPPVRTAAGYSIIQLEDRIEKPILTEYEFAARKKRLRMIALTNKRTQALHDLAREVEQELDIRYDSDVFAAVYELLVGTDPSLEVAPGDFHLVEENLLEAGRGAERSAWTVGDVFAESRFSPPEQLAGLRTEEQLQAYINGLVVRVELLRRARRAGLQRLPEYQNAVAFNMEGWLFDEAKQRFLSNLEVPEEDVRRYYEEQRGQYMLPERIRVEEILVDGEEEAARLFHVLQRDPERFTELAMRHSQRLGASANGGDLGFVTREQLGVLGDRLFDAAVGEVQAPLRIEDHFVILRVVDRAPPREKSYEEVRDQLVWELRTMHYEKQWLATRLEALRDRYQVVINNSAVVGLPILGDALLASGR